MSSQRACSSPWPEFRMLTGTSVGSGSEDPSSSPCTSVPFPFSSANAKSLGYFAELLFLAGWGLDALRTDPTTAGDGSWGRASSSPRVPRAALTPAAKPGLCYLPATRCQRPGDGAGLPAHALGRGQWPVGPEGCVGSVTSASVPSSPPGRKW